MRDVAHTRLAHPGLTRESRRAARWAAWLGPRRRGYSIRGAMGHRGRLPFPVRPEPRRTTPAARAVPPVPAVAARSPPIFATYANAPSTDRQAVARPTTYTAT